MCYFTSIDKTVQDAPLITITFSAWESNSMPWRMDEGEQCKAEDKSIVSIGEGYFLDSLSPYSSIFFFFFSYFDQIMS